MKKIFKILLGLVAVAAVITGVIIYLEQKGYLCFCDCDDCEECEDEMVEEDRDYVTISSTKDEPA